MTYRRSTGFFGKGIVNTSFLIGIVAAGLIQNEAVASTIDLYPRSDDINSLQAGEFYAQTFVAIGSSAQALTFDLQTNGFNTGRADTQFRLLLTTLAPNPFVGFGNQSPVKPGSILFASGNLVLGANADWTSFTVNLKGTSLSVGTSYAWVLDAATPWDGVTLEAGARVGAVRNSATGTGLDDAYPAGMFIFSSGPFDGSNWVLSSPSDYRDLVFRMDFANDVSAVPLHPSIVSEITGLGLFGLLVWIRKRRNIRLPS
jgi:hypothetical protein